MPVDVPSLRGKCEYEVETAINRIAAAVNQLEKTAPITQLNELRTGLANLRGAVDSLNQRFDDLYGACHRAGII